MWPDQYIEWAREAHPVLTRLVAYTLEQRYLATNPQLLVDSPEIVRDVIHHAFDMASARRPYSGYFTSSIEFNWWLASIAFSDLRNRLIERPEYAARILALPEQLLQTFGWVVYDGIATSEVARQLSVSSNEVERRASAALRFILE
jgi:DNA-directed RNA polymerase specialized sigma24 family protein